MMCNIKQFCCLLSTLAMATGTMFGQYFQQRVSYKIDVALNEKENTITGFESIDYTNKSSSTLSYIYFHLWPNAYKNENTMLAKQMLSGGNLSFYFAGDQDRGYIDSLDFYVNNKKARYSISKDTIDIMVLYLDEPLLPGVTISITTPFRVKLPNAKFSRLGHTGQAYYITQWYPKPAVFDQYGWHPMPYLNQGEFYSEFGDFDVNITLPANYIVGATGDLTTEREIARLDEMSKEGNFARSEMAFPPSDKVLKTLNYKQNNAHDFGWVADKRFHVLKGEVELPHTKRKVTLWAMFTPLEDHLWKNSIEYMHDGAYYYSLWNGDYPYNQITAVDGTIAAGTGMEYPNMTIIGQSRYAHILENVIVHEIGHNWFYGVLGSNERLHGWMDEGINTFYEMRYMKTKYPIEKFTNRNELTALGGLTKMLHSDILSDKQVRQNFYNLSALKRKTQPIDTKSWEFTSTNYGNVMYIKTGLAFDYLKEYLGTQMFDRCMQKYFETWKFRHPYPADIKKIFVDETGQNLDWFFDDFITKNIDVDFKLKKVLLNPDSSYTVTVNNKLHPSFPYNIITYKEQRQLQNKWILPGRDSSVISAGNYEMIGVGYDGATADINQLNNAMRTKGIFRRPYHSKLRFITGIDDGRTRNLYWNPYAFYNEWDGVSAGLSIHNYDIRVKKLNYHLSPAYGFNSKELCGFAYASANAYRSSGADFFVDVAARRFSELQLFYSIGNETFNAQYSSLVPGVEIHFKQRHPLSKIAHRLSAHAYMVWSNNNFVRTGDKLVQFKTDNVYPKLQYTYGNKRTLNPYSFETSVELVSGNLQWRPKLNTTFIYNVSFAGMSKGLTLRMFAGIMGRASHTTSHPAASSLYMSGTNTYSDYRYEYLFSGRNDFDLGAIHSHQFVANEGGFKIYTPTANSDKWIASVNITARSPKFKFISVFVDIGTYASAGNTFEGSKKVVYDIGLAFVLVKDYAEVYFPLGWSSDIKQFYEVNNYTRYADKVRFILNLHMIRPYKYLTEII